MLIPLLLLAIAVVLVGMRLIGKTSLDAMVLSVLLVGYVFGFDAWNANLGPVPLTLDRILLLALAGLFAWRWKNGQLLRTAITGTDWAIGLVLVVLTASCLLNKPGQEGIVPDSPTFRLIISFWTPAFLYTVLRHTRFDSRAAKRCLMVLTLLGIYLSVTALLETVGVWSLVFPRYIADPTLGLHYGRARGPGLNSVSLGVYLGICTSAAWLLVPSVSLRWKPLLLAAVGLMSFAVLLTYTRSTWLGLAGASVVLGTMQLAKPIRLPAFILAIVLGGTLLVVGKDALIGLKREDSASVSAHSVQQRTAFAYVSARMFQDNPLWGVGFGRFYDKKLPYLTDRTQTFELESIRQLHHHNTFLSLLTETGLLGLAAYLAVLVGMARNGWRLAHAEHLPPEYRRLGLLLLATLTVYLPSALFHDLSLLHSDQWLLFVVGGAGVGCWMNRVTLPATQPEPTPCPSLGFPKAMPQV